LTGSDSNDRASILPRDHSELDRLMRKGNRQAWLIVAAIVLPPIGLLVWSTYDSYLAPRADRKPFDSNEWKSTSTWTHWGRQTRHYMAEDLLATQRLDGKSRDSILDLLGEPDRGPLSKETRPYVDTYVLLPQFCVDDYWLLIRYDRKDQAEFAGIVGD
jgi:hypothetical protein